MTGAAETIPVDVLEVALRVVSAPQDPVQVSMVEAYAMCLYVLQGNNYPMPAERPVFGPSAGLSASLAARVAQVIAAHDAVRTTGAAMIASPVNDDALARQLADQVELFNALLGTLRTRFEKEFPSDGNR